MSAIGESPPRPDGFAKVSGAARYVDDVSLPGMWHGAILRSPHPHARIRSIRFNAAEAPEGAVCATAVEAAFAAADHVIEGTWRTGHQEHIPNEYLRGHAIPYQPAWGYQGRSPC